MDSAMADWLEEYPKKFRGALLMITHDRYFLDNGDEPHRRTGQGKAVQLSQSGYEGYLELKAEREAMAGELEQKRHEYPADGAGVDPRGAQGTQHEAERGVFSASRR